MSDRQEKSSLPWRAPTATWAAMMIGLLGLVWLGEAGPVALRFDCALILSAAMLAALAFGLVGVARERALVRLVAGAALVFLTLMILLSFTDLLTRPA